ncbi:elongation factor p (ef-p) kow family domain-containing protein [Toxoplasma gondii TgCatPRC2]|uniref:Elongation factor P n=3 Tax=Toxoplasma gondii TaxID=5811 RepID=A0A0F7UWU9_TOXGV|nr:elongation factor p (ef-p) kow family domain-containing protein [Toxoplasma gondii ME49]EPT29335.1 elongation factor p (ef-p) kow family domain-containing protein [Toxoplasma gondii ME49]ESS32189.1 elongation factor p (ef-p) kow family domain-containing protein [Toxoplasma gondii VEG]KYK70236.1 elongation factor p (ef-p) kow family domain-containing protein [Toxoplasma gondii TgCatPRC2]CEL74486.1 TPA: Elongation factor P [Toxoplasma gondii VEG]|eukprot:XP_002365052.2 elongation factor p (ef-p) kow family domain-containing protein [Toxoplasma gondii ME49]
MVGWKYPRRLRLFPTLSLFNLFLPLFLGQFVGARLVLVRPHEYSAQPGVPSDFFNNLTATTGCRLSVKPPDCSCARFGSLGASIRSRHSRCRQCPQDAMNCSYSCFLMPAFGERQFREPSNFRPSVRSSVTAGPLTDVFTHLGSFAGGNALCTGSGVSPIHGNRYFGSRVHSSVPFTLNTYISYASSLIPEGPVRLRPVHLDAQPHFPSSAFSETLTVPGLSGRGSTFLFAKVSNKDKHRGHAHSFSDLTSSGASETDSASTDKPSKSHGESHGGFSFMFPKTGGYVSSNDLRNGSCVIVGDQAFRVLQFQSVKMARAAAYVRARLKNLVTGATIDHNFRSDEKLQIPEIAVAEATFTGFRAGGGGGSAAKRGSKHKSSESAIMGEALKAAGMEKAGDVRGRDRTLVFMNKETWEEILITDRDIIERISGFLKEGMEVRFGLWEDKVVDIALPATETYTVTEISGQSDHSRGNPGRKQAILETGARISVPHFVEAGDRVVVRTSNGDFVKRGV